MISEWMSERFSAVAVTGNPAAYHSEQDATRDDRDRCADQEETEPRQVFHTGHATSPR